jgi:ElaA protein
MEAINWRWATFADLSLADLYAVMALRQRVFVVEQHCPYLDADGLDAGAWHLIVKTKQIVGGLRVLPAGARFPEMSIGRVCTAPEVRKMGLGREMMRRAIAKFGDRPLTLSAQSYLRRFYEEFGFVVVGDEYLEDDIPHMKMTRAATRPNSRPPARGPVA